MNITEGDKITEQNEAFDIAERLRTSHNPLVIPGFESLTKQQLFDMSARHILSTGKPSINSFGCCYRGIGCAAAPFLTEEGKAEGDSGNGDEEGSMSWWSSWTKTKHEEAFVRQLQACHDNANHSDLIGSDDFMTDWKRRMVELAGEHNLCLSMFM